VNCNDKDLARTLISAGLILLLAGLASGHLFVTYGLSEAGKIVDVDNADNALKQAFEAVLAAENAGANVSGLMVKLKQAGVFLAQAEMAYRNGDSDKATENAKQCLITLQGVSDEASASRDSALANSQQVFWQSVTISTIGAVAFLVALAFVWRRLSRRYLRKLLKMKPEVVPDADA
jgi:hypothetical protein